MGVIPSEIEDFRDQRWWREETRGIQTALDAVLANGVRLCEANFGTLILREGERFRVVAMYGAPQKYARERLRQPILKADPGTALRQVIKTRRPVQIADIRNVDAYVSGPSATSLTNLAGGRTLLSVPMLKDNNLVGAIGIFRQEVRPFTDKQIAFMQHFASQAVIVAPMFGAAR